MARTNPYDRDNHPGKFKIDYLGREQGFYVLQVRLTGHKSMDAHMFGVELSEWLMLNTQGEQYMGRAMDGRNGTPVLTMTHATNNDTFVALENFVDLILFEQAFIVDGISPAKLAA